MISACFIQKKLANPREVKKLKFGMCIELGPKQEKKKKKMK